MKKFKLFAITLLASSVALSGCLMPKKKSSTDTSDPTTTEPIPVSDWSDTVKKLMKDALQGVVLPFVQGTFTWKSDVDEGTTFVLGTANDTTAAKAQTVFKNTTGWEYLQDDDYGDPLYGYDVNGVGAVIANVYDGTAYSSAKCCITAYYYKYPVPTTDTEWNKTVSDIMKEVLGEEIPFYQFGEDYTADEYDVFTVNVYDYYPEDLRDEYCDELEKPANGYIEVDDYIYEKEVGTDGAKIHIELEYSDDYGNDIYASFIPVKTDVTSWDAIPVDEYETYSSITIPSFTSSKYTYYTHREVLYVDGVATTDLTEAYETALASTTMLYGSGSAVDWYEKLSISYKPLGTEDEETEEVTYTGFSIAISKGTPSSTFTENWPSDEIEAYLTDFEFENTVPSLTNSTGYKVKSFEYSYEDAFMDGYDEAVYISSIYEAFTGEGWTDAEIEAYADDYASNNAGYYVCMVDKSTNLVADYNALFDTDLWKYEQVTPSYDDEEEGEGESETGEVYHYWTENETGLTVCVYNEGNLFYVQICEPGDPTPVPGEEVSCDFSTLGFANQQEITEIVIDEATNTVVEFAVGTNPNHNTSKWYTSGNAIRCYGGNTVTVTSNVNIAQIVFTFGTGGDGNVFEIDEGTYEDGTWTASESTKSVEFSVSGTKGNLRLAGIAVTFAA